MGKSKRLYSSILITMLLLALSSIHFYRIHIQTDSSQSELPGSILQYRASSKSIVPSFFFVTIQQDTSQQSPNSPAIEPIPEKDTNPGAGQSEPNPSPSSPTWVQMIGALVNVFLSLYQSF